MLTFKELKTLTEAPGQKDSVYVIQYGDGNSRWHTLEPFASSKSVAVELVNSLVAGNVSKYPEAGKKAIAYRVLEYPLGVNGEEVHFVTVRKK